MSKPGMIYIKAKEGMVIHMPMAPRGKQRRLRMPEAGLWVPVGDPHWGQLLRFGDVEEAEAPPEEPASTPDTAKPANPSTPSQAAAKS